MKGLLRSAALSARSPWLRLGRSRASATPGVTSSEISLGGTFPLSGAMRLWRQRRGGALAYFKYVNAKGGVFGRKIDFTYLDDAYDPGRVENNTIGLVQQEQVFAVFSCLGTNNNLAVRERLNDKKVPQLFVSSGATTFGRDYKRYPWTIGYIPPYSAEGAIYGKYVVGTIEGARSPCSTRTTTTGATCSAGLHRGLGKKAGSIVAKVGYDPTSTDVQPQVTRTEGIGANVFMVFAFGKFSLQAFNAVSRLNWKPQIFVNDVSSASALMLAVPQKAANGAISIVFGKDPASPQWSKDKGVSLFRTILKKYGDGIGTRDLKDGYFSVGMATAYTMVTTLKKAGKNLTRDSLMRAATHLNEKNNPFILPGIVVHTTPTSRFPITQVGLQRYHNGRWVSFGGLFRVR